MRYCPHCRKPSARVHGPCPHCGRSLSEDGPAPRREATEPRRQPPSAETAPSFDIHSVGNHPDRAVVPPKDAAGWTEPAFFAASGLELDAACLSGERDLPGHPPSAPKSPQALAGFPTAREGVVGTLRYWYLVRRRLAALRKDLEDATRAETAERGRASALQAELGRAIHDQGGVPELTQAIDAALLAEGERKDLERKRAGQFLLHENEINAVKEAIARVAQQSAPTLAQLEHERAQERAVLGEARGLETQRKRAEIDLRNMQVLIQKRRERLTHPQILPSESAALQKEIVTFEQRCAVIGNQIAAFEKERQRLEVLLSSCRLSIDHLNGVLLPGREENAALQTRLRASEDALAVSERETLSVLTREAERADELWAEVARSAVTRSCPLPETLTERRQAVIEATNSAEATARHTEIIREAMTCYDRRMIRRARRLAAAAAATGLLLVVAAVAFCTYVFQ